VAAFAALGLILAALGIYGVVSYSVARQTREFGIRMALGASPSLVRRSVLTNSLQLAAAGIALGFAGSVLGSQIITSLLFETEPRDPLTFAAVVVLLVGVAMLAGYVPALRATRIHPALALRVE